MNDRLYCTAVARFEAARRLTSSPQAHETRLHGHSFLVGTRTTVSPRGSPFLGTEVETLTQDLQKVVAPLDYTLLNEHLPNPTDAALAAWMGARLSMRQWVQIRIRSAPNQGLVVHADGTEYGWRRFRFEAAHQLPNVPPGHQCGRMHGHSFAVVLWTSPPNLALVEAAWAPWQEQLHHTCLNDLPGLANPTSERFAEWLWTRLLTLVPMLSRITVCETATAGCHYDGRRYRIWKEHAFESALSLSPLPRQATSFPFCRGQRTGKEKGTLYGHSYTVRLHLTAPLDEGRGWTVDYGEVKAKFDPLYRQLDHHCLNELAGLTEPTLGALLLWIRERLAPELPQLHRIDLEQTPGCGAILRWDSL